MIEDKSVGIKKYRGVIIDTINQMQQDKHTEVLTTKGKAAFDDWTDYSLDVLNLYKYVKNLAGDPIIVQVLGYEGSGKTCGVMGLNEHEFIYINSDKKPITFTDGKKRYPSDNSKKNYSKISSFEDLKIVIKKAYDKKLDGPFLVFVLAHIEDYKSAEGVQRQRMKFLGKMASKNNIEGAVVHSYYTKIDPAYPFDSSDRYRLETVNNGFNTARAPMGYFTEASIQNNFQNIVNKILEDYGLEVKKDENKE